MATMTFPSVAQQLAISSTIDPAAIVNGFGMHPLVAGGLISVVDRQRAVRPV